MIKQANLDQLHPVFRMTLDKILRELAQRGWQPVVAEATRNESRQAEKVKKGFSKTMHSWHVPSTAAILWETKNTYSIVRGNAADVVDRRYGWGGPAASLDYGFWKDLGAVAKDNGCIWGGDWKSFKDVAHIEMNYVDERPRDTAFV